MRWILHRQMDTPTFSTGSEKRGMQQQQEEIRQSPMVLVLVTPSRLIESTIQGLGEETPAIRYIYT
ncbi:unnamed protein product [Linum tenue]|uniref:Uncharacterized protein n=1 Tax=Linum tenue TaxID=586396 RepID=A0AAV0H7W0_9ROSI|nr:unnamed protein product [Linum tenue]